MSIAILFNPVSGSGRALKQAQLVKAGLELDGVQAMLVATETRGTEYWLDPLLRSKKKAVRALAVCGGDGAVRLVARSAASAGVPIWHVPCGTENLFARAFGMRRDVQQLRAALRTMRVRQVDLGSANHEPFVLMGSMGVDARVVHALAKIRRGPISHLSYLAPVMECLRAWKAPHLAWEIAGEREELGQGIVVVGNFREYGVRLNPAARADHTDGLLDAIFLPVRSPIALLRWIPLLRFGLQQHCSDMRERRARQVRVIASEREALQLDGDAVGHHQGELDVTFRVQPSALPVLLPSPKGAKSSVFR
ncbi:MAG: hypothetical protein EXS10_03390 [Phycisphaerales bacterium]|nr:hypothetical protein [Phycisphaerales bacterium]